MSLACHSLADEIKPEARVRMGDALADIGRKLELTEEDIAVFERVRDRGPTEPLGFD